MTESGIEGRNVVAGASAGGQAESRSSRVASPGATTLRQAGLHRLSAELEGLRERLAAAGALDGGGVLATLDRLRACFDALTADDGVVERERADLAAALARSEADRLRYEELFELAPDAYLLTDQAGRILHANRGAARMLGRPVRLLLGKPVAAFVAPQDRRRFRDALTDAGADPRARELSFELGPRATARYVRASVGPAHGRDAETEAALRWIVRDVTPELQQGMELRRLADELEERVAERTRELGATTEQLGAERARLAQLLERLPDGVVAPGPEGAVLFANAAAAGILGEGVLAEDATLPARWNGIELRALAAQLARGGEPVERLVEREDGAAYRLIGVPAAAGANALLVLVDVTARRRVERSRRHFVMNAAHELRTPLAAIVAAVDVLQSGAKEIPEERDRFLEHVEQQSHRLNRVAHSLLVLARAESGEERPPLEIVPLAPLLLDLARGSRSAPGVTVAVTCVPDLAALANAALVEQALATIVANAVRYTTEGRVVLSARRENGRVVVDVTDTGTGIAEDLRAQLFARFSRGAGDGDGFGLGLAIAKEALEAIGGTIELEPGPAGGTTARVTLRPARLRTP